MSSWTHRGLSYLLCNAGGSVSHLSKYQIKHLMDGEVSLAAGNYWLLVLSNFPHYTESNMNEKKVKTGK